MEKYNYRPNAVARNLQKGKSNTVGFLIPHVYQEYFPLVYSVFEREMTERGYVTIVFNGKSTPEDIAFTGFDGVDLSRQFRPQLTTIQMDFETMGRKLAELAYNSIMGERTVTDILVDPKVEIRQSTNG